MLFFLTQLWKIICQLILGTNWLWVLPLADTTSGADFSDLQPNEEASWEKSAKKSQLYKMISFFINITHFDAHTRCRLDGDTMLLFGEGVVNLIVADVSMPWAGLEWVGPLLSGSASSSSSMASALSPSCWFTSFRRSTTSSMDTGNYRRRYTDLNVVQFKKQTPLPSIQSIQRLKYEMIFSYFNISYHMWQI